MSDAAWAGAAWGISLHAIVSFFSAFLDGLEPLLAIFRPPEHLAFAVSAGAPPLARWATLLVFEGVFWALAAVVLVAVARETATALRIRLSAPGQRPVASRAG